MAQQVPTTTGRPQLLSRVVRGTVEAPPRVFIYGPPGVGKSTLACSAPDVIVIQGEEGTQRISTSRLPRPEGWAGFRDQIQALIDEPHSYRTLVIDGVDGLEGLLFADICAEARADAIEKAWGGYAKGYTRAVERWREVLSMLERLIEKRGMGVTFCAHSQCKTFGNPEGADYDRYIPKLNERAWGVFHAWCDAVLFAQYETATIGEADEKGKAFSTGKRMLHTERGAAWEAKNRYGFPSSLVLPAEDGWLELQKYIDAPKRLRAEIEELATKAAPELATAVRQWLATASDNAAVLTAGLERLRERMKSN